MWKKKKENPFILTHCTIANFRITEQGVTNVTSIASLYSLLIHLLNIRLIILFLFISFTSFFADLTHICIPNPTGDYGFRLTSPNPIINGPQKKGNKQKDWVMCMLMSCILFNPSTWSNHLGVICLHCKGTWSWSCVMIKCNHVCLFRK